jgi:phage-related protein
MESSLASVKPILWVGSSLADLRAFPANARRRAGFELGKVQCGLEPFDWKPLSTIGAGLSSYGSIRKSSIA